MTTEQAAIRESCTLNALITWMAATWPGTMLPLLEQARTDMRQSEEFRYAAGRVIGIVRQTFGDLEVTL